MYSPFSETSEEDSSLITHSLIVLSDFLSNMIVKNAQDLKVVAVVDWEWTYAGPCQLFWSAPRWLVIEPLVNWGSGHDKIRLRYEKYLRGFAYIRIPE